MLRVRIQHKNTFFYHKRIFFIAKTFGEFYERTKNGLKHEQIHKNEFSKCQKARKHTFRAQKPKPKTQNRTLKSHTRNPWFDIAKNNKASRKNSGPYNLN